MLINSRICGMNHQSSRSSVRPCITLKPSSLLQLMHRLPSPPFNALGTGSSEIWNSKDKVPKLMQPPRRPPPPPPPLRSNDESMKETASKTNADHESINIRELNYLLSHSMTMSSLLNLCQKQQQRFDHIHPATAVTRASTILLNKKHPSDINDFLAIVEIARGFIPIMQAQALSNFIYSLAKAGLVHNEMKI